MASISDISDGELTPLDSDSKAKQSLTSANTTPAITKRKLSSSSPAMSAPESDATMIASGGSGSPQPASADVPRRSKKARVRQRFSTEA
jgi:hypothetical protein